MTSNLEGKRGHRGLPEPQSKDLAGPALRLWLWAFALPLALSGPPTLCQEKLYLMMVRTFSALAFSRLNPDSLAMCLSQPRRGGLDTWLRGFKTAFPKYLSDWQMEMLYAGAGGARIGNKMKDARENINSVGGQDGAWRCSSASLFPKLLFRPAKRHLFVRLVYHSCSSFY